MTTVKESIPVNKIQSQSSADAPSKITRVTTSDGRYYKVLGEKLPSVSSVLQVIPKPALVEWRIKKALFGMYQHLSSHSGEPITPELLNDASNEGQIESIKEAQDAAAIGSAVHELISIDLLDNEVDEDEIDEDLKCGYQSYLLWKKEKGSELNLVDSETAVYMSSDATRDCIGYAGTIDALFKKADGKFLLVDFKTSKRIYVDHLVQLWSYVKTIESAVASSMDMTHWNDWMKTIEQNGIAAQVIRLNKRGRPGYEVSDLLSHDNNLHTSHNLSNESVPLIWKSALELYTSSKGFL